MDTVDFEVGTMVSVKELNNSGSSERDAVGSVSPSEVMCDEAAKNIIFETRSNFGGYLHEIKGCVSSVSTLMEMVTTGCSENQKREKYMSFYEEDFDYVHNEIQSIVESLNSCLKEEFPIMEKIAEAETVLEKVRSTLIENGIECPENMTSDEIVFSYDTVLRKRKDQLCQSSLQTISVLQDRWENSLKKNIEHLYTLTPEKNAEKSLSFTSEIFNSLIQFILSPHSFDQIRREKISINDLIDSVVEEKGSDIAVGRNSILVDHMDEIMAYCFPEKMKSVLRNLLSNSCKFTKDGEISIRTYNESMYAVIEVKDTGEGIEDVENIVGRTGMLGSTKVDSSGEGIPFCRKVLQEHGGELQIMKNPDGGTIVRALFIPPFAKTSKEMDTKIQ